MNKHYTTQEAWKQLIDELDIKDKISKNNYVLVQKRLKSTKNLV